ncbi:MFS transporter [Aminiphilus circumscriptus]|uniref:MFS transporter n=1 Tax=Aminiphilus circumscriptus TaxID=290732 RepID=UPI0006866BA2|nr:MFS transporter [Aminiphilus circumscriptus]
MPCAAVQGTPRRGVQDLAAAGGAVVGRAVVQDLASGAEAHRVMSYITMVFGLAPAIAPILGGWLHVLFGWRSVFLFLAAFALLMSVAFFRLLPESLPRGMRHRFRPAGILADYGKVVRNMRFLRLILSMGTFFIGFGLYIGSAASFVINILHQPETGFGWLFVPLVAGMVTGAATSARLTRRFFHRGHHPDRLRRHGGGGAVQRGLHRPVCPRTPLGGPAPHALRLRHEHRCAGDHRHGPCTLSRKPGLGGFAAGLRPDPHPRRRLGVSGAAAL